MAYVVQQIVKTTEEWAEFDQENIDPIPENYWLFEQVTDETGTYYKFKISDGIRLFGKLPYQLLNGRSAKINEAGDMMIFDDVQQMYVNSGVTVSAYHIAVKYENFKGSIHDFAKQFANFNKYGEQQGGRFVNAGPGWNSFSYPEEFGEEVFVTATVEDKAAFVSVRNIKKTGFHYCVYNADGHTVPDNVVINYNAVTMSNQNLSRSMAKAASLNPFDYDNLEQLFSRNAAEIVANETAFDMTKRSSMVAAKYLCYLTGLDLYQYHNVASAAADEAAMNIIATSSAARGFVGSSPAAYDALRLSEMAMTKYSISLTGLAPDNFSSMSDIFDDENALNCLVNHPVAMQAIAGSPVAMQAIRGQQAALDTVLNSSIAMQEVAKVSTAVSSFFNDANALTCLVNSSTAMTAVAGSSTAMTAVAGSSTAMTAVAGSSTAMTAIMANSSAKEKFFGSNYSVGRGIATYANISSNTLIGLQSMAAVAGSATAMAAVAGSATAMAAVAGSTVASKAVDPVINSYSNDLYATLNSSSAFTKTTQEYAHPGATNGTHCTGQTATGNTITFVTFIKDTGSGANTFIVTSIANNNQLINQQITQTTVNFNPKKVALRGVSYDFGTYYPQENRLGLEIFTVK